MIENLETLSHYSDREPRNHIGITQCNFYFNTGVVNKISFIKCDCEPLIMSLVCDQLWSAIPQYPQLVFSFELLDLAEALLLAMSSSPQGPV